MNTEQKIIKTKLGLLALAKQLGNVSQAGAGGADLTGRGVRGVWQRHDLETMQKRVRA